MSWLYRGKGPKNVRGDVENGFDLIPIPLERTLAKPAPVDACTGPKEDLIRTISCLDKGAPIDDLQEPAQAYLGFLEATFARISTQLLQVIYTESLTDQSTAGIQARLYAITGQIAMATSAATTQEVSVHGICTKLAEKGLIENKPAEAAPLVFVLFGALTMLYTPVLDPEPGKLQMCGTERRSDHLHRRRKATWHTNSQELCEDDINISFVDLLFRYCRLQDGPIPVPKCPPVRFADAAGGVVSTSVILRSENLNFYTLDKLMRVNIQWTTSICEHLEFDLRSKKLKLFQVPSYCVILCTLEPEKTFLDSLFRKFLKDQTTSFENGALCSADFFREVLGSYRLIFGQHEDARKLIRKYTARGRWFGKPSPFWSTHPSALPRGGDPLLNRLCFQDSRTDPLFVHLDIPYLKNIYVLESDFPYFAARLAALQEFVENQCPNNWQVLWRDRRDIAKFWTVWAVLLIGGPTILLAIIQIILTGVQIQAIR